MIKRVLHLFKIHVLNLELPYTTIVKYVFLIDKNMFRYLQSL